MKRLILATLFLALPTLFVHAAVQTDPDKYVRTANYFLLSGRALETPEAKATLPKFDLLILPVEAQVYNAAFFAHARQMNPDIIILAYVVSTSWNNLYWNDTLHTRMRQGIADAWWLTDGNGNRTSNWPGLTLLNLHSGWTDYLANFTATQILATGLWDGVMYDDVGEGISSIGSADVNMDGRADEAGSADALWRAGYVRLAARTRELAGPGKLILTNGSSRTELAPYVNGRMFESFPTPWEGDWATVTRKYVAEESRVKSPVTNIVNGGTDNTGRQNDYADMRYGLTTTLLGGGYFGYDFGTTRHNDLWYYDEYDAWLGAPSEGRRDRMTPGNTTIKPSVWERRFERGTVIVNSTTERKRVRLNGEYEHLRGTQDSTVNSGRIVSSVDVNAKDGVILLRTIEEIMDAVYQNGSFARVFRADGSVKRNGFFPFDDRASGGERVMRVNLDSDTGREWIVAGNSRVDLYDENGSKYKSFFPYTEAYKLGVNIAVGDLENDGSMEIVTGTERGGGPQIRIFNKDGNLIHPGFFAYDKAFRGGVNVAIGDLNGDAISEVIAGAGVGGGPHVRVFNKDGKVINPGFFAYDPAFRGGVNVASADVTGDGIDDIITGPGKGGGPEVRVFDRNGKRSAAFFAFDKNSRAGVEVSATDLDHDGTAEILGFSDEPFAP
ncbi:hypothetical protein HYW18_04170 [Candidatus Uhrbacteria bacterium]|nr:hypothetical protein [Candidatus Uhrbacteria bacterium]